MIVNHVFEPVFDKNSKVLILGTMPSPKSRELGFYYGHPRNRFWPVMADVFHAPYPESIQDKISFCHTHGIAIWDVLASCEIQGADDNSIKNPVANDLSQVLDHAPVQAVFTTGSKAYTLYQKHCFPVTGMEAIQLPSTSPANCRISYDALVEAYGAIRV